MMQQKLVTIVLHEPLERSPRRETVQEHLQSYLARGWRIMQIHPCGTAVGATAPGATGWLAVLLGLPDPVDQDIGFSNYRERSPY